MELGSVQNKLTCVFEIEVLSESSDKRSHQSYRVVATDTLRREAVDHNVSSSRASEKMDGTCVMIAKFKEKPWLWARHDRRPTKPAEKKFRAFQSKHRQLLKGDNSGDSFTWDIHKDFKDVPDHWVPATGVQVVDGVPQPEANGHIPGWVPVQPSSRQHCWHLSAVQLDTGLAVVLREDDLGELEIVAVPLAELEGHTAELIGTNINANPYSIGSKQCPVHLLVVHGSIRLRDPPQLSLQEIRDWFTSTPTGMVEGIVWHCQDKTLFKLHRHHLELPWPVKSPSFSQRPVTLRVDVNNYNITGSVSEKPSDRNMFRLFGEYPGIQLDSVSNIHDVIAPT